MLNENIKNLRRQKGYTQQTLAEALNVVRQTVSKWEKGYSVPDALTLEKMAELFEVSVSELLDEKASAIEQTPEVRRIADQLSVLNNQIANEIAKKRRRKKIALILLLSLFFILTAVFLFCFLFSFRQNNTPITPSSEPITNIPLDSTLENAVHETILRENARLNSKGECDTESHLVYEVSQSDSLTHVYLTEYYSSFGFVNGFFTDVSGHAIPADYTFERKKDGYSFVSRKYPMDGEYYVDSVQKMFPLSVANKVLYGVLEPNTQEELWQTRVSQAKEYLSTINRSDAACVSYERLNIVFLTDYGINEEVVNKLDDLRLEYDRTVGNHEIIENGTRYVYQTEYNSFYDRVTLTKFVYDTKKVVEFLAFNGKTGEAIPNAPFPEQVTYYRGGANIEREYTTVARYEQEN